MRMSDWSSDVCSSDLRCIERPVRTVDRLERTADRAATGGENRCVGRVEQVTAERGRFHVEAFGRRRIGRGRGIAITVGDTPDVTRQIGRASGRESGGQYG